MRSREDARRRALNQTEKGGWAPLSCGPTRQRARSELVGWAQWLWPALESSCLVVGVFRIERERVANFCMWKCGYFSEGPWVSGSAAAEVLLSAEVAMAMASNNRPWHVGPMCTVHM